MFFPIIVGGFLFSFVRCALIARSGVCLLFFCFHVLPFIFVLISSCPLPLASDRLPVLGFSLFCFLFPLLSRAFWSKSRIPVFRFPISNFPFRISEFLLPLSEFLFLFPNSCFRICPPLYFLFYLGFPNAEFLLSDSLLLSLLVFLSLFFHSSCFLSALYPLVVPLSSTVCMYAIEYKKQVQP